MCSFSFVCWCALQHPISTEEEWMRVRRMTSWSLLLSRDRGTREGGTRRFASAMEAFWLRQMIWEVVMVPSTQVKQTLRQGFQYPILHYHSLPNNLCEKNLRWIWWKKDTYLSQLDVPLVHSHLIIGKGQSREKKEHDRFALSIHCHSESTIGRVHGSLR